MAYKCKYCQLVLTSHSSAQSHKCRKKPQSQMAGDYQPQSQTPLSDFTVTSGLTQYSGDGGAFGGAGASGSWDSGSSSSGDGGGGGGGGD